MRAKLRQDIPPWWAGSPVSIACTVYIIPQWRWRRNAREGEVQVKVWLDRWFGLDDMRAETRTDANGAANLPDLVLPDGDYHLEAIHLASGAKAERAFRVADGKVAGIRPFKQTAEGELMSATFKQIDVWRTYLDIKVRRALFTRKDAPPEIPLDYELYLDKTTSFGKTYNGVAERCLFGFNLGPEQLDFAQTWLIDKFVGHLQNAIEEQGGRLISLRLWRNIEHPWHTPYRGEIIARVPEAQGLPGEMMASMRSPFAPVLWLPIIVKALAVIIALIIGLVVIDKVTTLFWGRTTTKRFYLNPNTGEWIPEANTTAEQRAAWEMKEEEVPAGGVPWGLIAIGLVAAAVIVGGQRGRK